MKCKHFGLGAWAKSGIFDNFLSRVGTMRVFSTWPHAGFEHTVVLDNHNIRDVDLSVLGLSYNIGYILNCTLILVVGHLFPERNIYCDLFANDVITILCNLSKIWNNSSMETVYFYRLCALFLLENRLDSLFKTVSVGYDFSYYR